MKGGCAPQFGHLDVHLLTCTLLRLARRSRRSARAKRLNLTPPFRGLPNRIRQGVILQGTAKEQVESRNPGERIAPAAAIAWTRVSVICPLAAAAQAAHQMMPSSCSTPRESSRRWMTRVMRVFCRQGSQGVGG